MQLSVARSEVTGPVQQSVGISLLALLQLTGAVLTSSGSVCVFSYVFEVYLQGFLSIEYTFTFERLPLILVTSWSYKFHTLDQQSKICKVKVEAGLSYLPILHYYYDYIYCVP